MKKTSRIKTANIVRNMARYSLLVISILVFIFALFSGAEAYGGGINGLIKNSPNALPWVLLLFLVYIAWKWELIGGAIVSLLGLFMVYFFNFTGSNFYPITFIITLFITLFGLMFLYSWYLRIDNEKS